VIFGVDGLAKFWFDRMHDSPDLVFTPGPSQIKVRSDGTAVVKFLYTLSGHRHLYLPSLTDSTGGSSGGGLNGTGAVGADGVDVFMKCVTSYFCPFEDQLVPLNKDGNLHLIVPPDQRPVFTPSDAEANVSASSEPVFGPAVSSSPSPRPATPIGAALPSARSLVMPFVLGGVVTFHLDEQSLIRKFDMRYDLLK
jgi:hypothetical protein